MDRRLLTAAALVAALSISSTAAAEHAVGAGVPNAKPAPGFMVNGPPGFGNLGPCRNDGRHQNDGRFACVGVNDWAYADGQWALYNNRSWAPDSYNDWWNDRPDRAYPRWVQEQRARNGPCDPDRMWWSGSGWHC